MGLMDILNGMQHGPRGVQKPSAPGQSGGMSPIMLALLGLLAYKALKGGASGGTPAGAPPSPPPSGGLGGSVGDILGGLLGGAGQPSGSPTGPAGGNISDVLGGLLGGLLGGAAGPASGPTGAPAGGNISDVLGGLLGGGAAGNVLNKGLGNVLRDLQNAGHGDTAKSWVSTGANQQIAPDDLAHALGADAISTLTRQTGLSRDELLAGLAQHLPNLVDQLTPEGRLPTEEEVKKW
jgi:uncharacterized protein YidB (DUF937 family)